jgi:hypothetical protein
MTTQKDLELVGFLSNGTTTGQIQWQAAAESDQFVTGLRGKYAVTLGKIGNICYLSMKDPDGRELLSISSEETYAIEPLFDSVRRAALKVDEAIDDIIRG